MITWLSTSATALALLPGKSLLLLLWPCQQEDRLSEQIVGVLDRAASEDGLGVYRVFECAFEQAALLGLFDALSKGGLDRVMEE